MVHQQEVHHFVIILFQGGCSGLTMMGRKNNEIKLGMLFPGERFDLI